MKKYILICVLAFIALTKSNAQQDVMVSQYMFNGLFLNPAYAGTHNYVTSTFLSRIQWLNFDGAPKTSLIALDGPLAENKMGWGLIVANDKIGVTTQNDFYGNYSYFVKLGKGKLGFGIKAGVSQYTAKVGDLTVWDENDPSFTGTKRSALIPKFGFGTYYYTEKWYAGFSIPALIAYDKNYDFDISMEKSSAIRKHYYLTGGYVFNVNEKLKFKPSLLVKHQSAAPIQADVNVSFMYMDAVSVGASYRTNDAVVVMAEYQANKRFRVGYAFDITTSKMANYSSGSHEIMIGYDFGKDIIKTKTPRFF